MSAPQNTEQKALSSSDSMEGDSHLEIYCPSNNEMMEGSSPKGNQGTTQEEEFMLACSQKKKESYKQKPV